MLVFLFILHKILIYMKSYTEHNIIKLFINQLDMELTKIDISNIIEGFYVFELYGSTKKEVFKFNIIRSK